jgi:serine/threonine-protein kinase
MFLKPGKLISGKYRILRLIGDGGMGSVYEAQHEVLGSRVALKFLHPEIARQRGLKERFLQEARVSATVESPHICRVSDVDTSEDGAYLVMELLPGEPLQALLDRETRLESRRAVDLAIQMLTGLWAAHQQGVVHRDLKPDNVFVLPNAHGVHVKLLDFGIAKLRHTEEYKMVLTRPGAVMGTPEYMAPEQAFSADLVDQRSDLYSVGVILFEMLAGSRPVEGNNAQFIAEQIVTGKVKRLDTLRPELPAQLVAIVRRAIEGNPDLRFANAAEFMDALAPYAPLARQSSGFENSRNLTGAATPFTPVSKTPNISELQIPSSASTAATSAVKTLPPETEEPPAVSRFAGPPKTTSMPEFPAVVARPVPTVGAPAPNISRRKRSSWPWLAVALGALTGAACLWQFTSVFQDLFLLPGPTPPPQPTRREIVAQVEFVLPEEIEQDGSDPQRGTSKTTPRPKDDTDDQRLPGLPLPSQLPSITLPTSLPPGFPTAFPTALPTTFPLRVAPSPSATN